MPSTDRESSESCKHISRVNEPSAISYTVKPTNPRDSLNKFSGTTFVKKTATFDSNATLGTYIVGKYESSISNNFDLHGVKGNNETWPGLVSRSTGNSLNKPSETTYVRVEPIVGLSAETYTVERQSSERQEQEPNFESLDDRHSTEKISNLRFVASPVNDFAQRGGTRKSSVTLNLKSSDKQLSSIPELPLINREKQLVNAKQCTPWIRGGAFKSKIPIWIGTSNDVKTKIRQPIIGTLLVS